MSWALQLVGEKWPGWRKAKLTLQASKEHDPELKKVYGKLLHEVYFRLDDALQGRSAVFCRKIWHSVEVMVASCPILVQE
jgi:hypothetical protein